ncbi:unnamed protein product [Prorocentrum cordatum]|uniref:Uncharacterized protein n=1 Tax=Prorocentrum cordatum TaxID=2364126 RepID=A0ABN9TIJ0_9DINO|nr:unnamed protein product [Polarella glacialis]
MGDESASQPLTDEVLCECLSQIKQSADGRFAYARLDCSNKELTDLGSKVGDYKQLQHIVLSSNRLTEVTAVTKLPYLLSLEIDSNDITSLKCMQTAELPWCQKLNLSSNKLDAVLPLATLTSLRFLNLSANAITSLEGFGGHQTMEQLELQGNQLTNLKGMGELGSLKALNISGNQLTSLEGLTTPRLESLDASSNQLASLEYVGGAPLLTALNLQGNQFDAEDPQLPELRRLGTDTPRLQSLQLSGTPMADTCGDNTKVEALVCAPSLRQVDDEDVTREDRDAARDRAQELVEMKLQKEREEAEAREQAEREAAEAAEAAAAEAAEREAAAAEAGAAAAVEGGGEDGEDES